jgi:hypothetical protein
VNLTSDVPPPQEPGTAMNALRLAPPPRAPLKMPSASHRFPEAPPDMPVHARRRNRPCRILRCRRGAAGIFSPHHRVIEIRLLRTTDAAGCANRPIATKSAFSREAAIACSSCVAVAAHILEPNQDIAGSASDALPGTATSVTSPRTGCGIGRSVQLWRSWQANPASNRPHCPSEEYNVASKSGWRS